MKKSTYIIIIIFILSLIMLLFPVSSKAENQAQIYIDYPIQDEVCKDKIYIHGWFMSALEDKSLKIFIDEEKNDVTEKIERYNRPDVTGSVKGYGTPEQNPLAGYKGYINIEKYKDGKHTLFIQVINNKNNDIIAENKKTFTIKKYNTQIYIDYPVQNQKEKNSVYIHGWLMSEAKNKELKIYIDNEKNEVTKSIERYNRPDVTGSVKGYGTPEQNPLAGYKGTINLTNYEDGQHTIIVKIINTDINEVIAIEKRNINIEKYNSQICIDYPKYNQQSKVQLNIHGWIMSETKDKELKVYIDEEKNDVTANIKRYDRPDVTGSVKGYGTPEQNPLAGFDGIVDLSNYKEGNHTVIIKIKDTILDKVIKEARQTFYLKKYNTQIYMDYPCEGQYYRNLLKVHGWYMSDQKDKKIYFYLNNKNINNDIKLYNRPDVTGSVKGYGTPEQNPLAGFDGIVDVSKYNSGEYILKIEVYSTITDEIIASTSSKINLNKYIYEEGTYGISGLKVKRSVEGNDLKYYRIGEGKNVLFTVFSVHGFEDGWNNDGQELSYIANRFKDNLVQNQMNYQDILNNWTIYIFPCANSDGQYYGWDNNGGGRTTIYSAAPKNQGIDMNRCWSVGYTRKTSKREYNGTEPFQAYEARYLRDFLLNKKSSSGKTILIDLHGWLNESIGDNSLGVHYRNQFGMKTHISSYGAGYMINWARSLSNTKSALIELPSARNHNEVVNNDYAGKYIRATINMLRNN